jgi:hypothetical protein
MWNGETVTRCVDPGCWERKQEAHIKAEQDAIGADLKAKGQKLVDLSKLKYGEYVEFSSSSEWNGIDQTECQTCEKRQTGKRSYGGMTKVCLNPLCHRKKKAAATRAAKAAEREAFEAEMADIERRATEIAIALVHGSEVHFDRRTLINLALLVLKEVASSYERPTLFRYVQRSFGWEDDFWKSGWTFGGELGKAMQRLESLTTEQVLRVVFEWPAVARGFTDDVAAHCLGLPVGRRLGIGERHCPSCQRTTMQEHIDIRGLKHWRCRACHELEAEEGDAASGGKVAANG